MADKPFVGKGGFDANGLRGINLADPVNPQDFATKLYVDTHGGGGGGGGNSTPGGPNTALQINDGGSLNGSANLTFALGVLFVNGAANIIGNVATGNLLIRGVTTANGNVTVNGFVNIASTLSVAAAVSFGSTIAANGTVGTALQVLTSGGPGQNAYWLTLPADADPDANTTTAGFINTSAQTLAGDKTWNGNTTLNGFANIATTLQVAGLSTLTGNAELGGYANVASTLQVAGIATFNSNTIHNANVGIFGGSVLTVSGNATVQSNLHVLGTSAQDANAVFGANVNVTNSLYVGGLADITGNLITRANVTLTGVLVATSNLTANVFDVTANLTVSGLSTLTGNVTTVGFVNIGSTLQVAGNTIIGGWANVAGMMNVTGNSTLTGNVTTGGFVNVGGALQVTSTALINGLLTANAGLVVNGAASFNNTVSANASVGASTQVLTSGGPGQNVYWATLSGGGGGGSLIPDANSSTSGLINTAAQSLNGVKTWLSNAVFSSNVTVNGHVGIAGAPVSNAVLAIYGEYYSVMVNKGNSGPTMTINWSDGNEQYVNLNSNVTFTFTNPVDGGRYVLLVGAGTGSWSITHDAAVLWPDNRAPIMSQFANKYDLYTFQYVAAISKYIGSYNQNYN